MAQSKFKKYRIRDQFFLLLFFTIFAVVFGFGTYQSRHQPLSEIYHLIAGFVGMALICLTIIHMIVTCYRSNLNNKDLAKDKPYTYVVAGFFALILAVMCLWGFQTTYKIVKEGNKTQAVIYLIEVEYDMNGEADEHRVYVEYVVAGKTYDQKLNSYSPSMREGQEITIYYEKNNPTNITKKETMWYLLPSSAIVFSVSVYCGYKTFSKKQ